MYIIEAKCPYHDSCGHYVGGIACLNYNWEKMVCFQERKKKDDDMKEMQQKIKNGIRVYESR